jgi:hypothetical protein
MHLPSFSIAATDLTPATRLAWSVAPIFTVAACFALHGMVNRYTEAAAANCPSTVGGGYRHQVTPNREGEDINVTPDSGSDQRARATV